MLLRKARWFAYGIVPPGVLRPILSDNGNPTDAGLFRYDAWNRLVGARYNARQAEQAGRHWDG